MNNDLRRIPFLVSISRKARIIIYQNLVTGILIMIGGVTLAGFGLLNPIMAALLHNIGALVVLFNSARLVKTGETLKKEPVT